MMMMMRTKRRPCGASHHQHHHHHHRNASKYDDDHFEISNHPPVHSTSITTTSMTMMMILLLLLLCATTASRMASCVNSFQFSSAHQKSLEYQRHNTNPLLLPRVIQQQPHLFRFPPWWWLLSSLQSSSSSSSSSSERAAITTFSDNDIDTTNTTTTTTNNSTNTTTDRDNTNRTAEYELQGLYDNLQAVLDQYMMSGNQQQQQQRAYAILQQIQLYENDQNEKNDNTDTITASSSYYQRAQRLIQRTGLTLPPPPQQQEVEDSPSKSVVFGWSTSNTDQRRDNVNTRKEWDTQQQQQHEPPLTNPTTTFNSNSNNEPLQREKQFMQDKTLLEEELQNNNPEQPVSSGGAPSTSTPPDDVAMNRVAALLAQRARRNNGNLETFDGSAMFGIGGLDDILQQIHRRIFIPLISPPQLLAQLGMTPVRGLLLYGPPGCGKTLMAREIGRYISPLRPITVLSGPEIMDKFVGSSEMKLRNIFDNPPNLYEAIRQQEPDQGVALSKVALHVIIMDEFDAIARQRGGRQDGISKNSGGSDQGDAGVARDSVVNQLLAKMDGVLPLPVPTLVIGVTNQRSLIDTALLRPGRFEIQIEVPPPKTMEQRKSILEIHTRHMYTSGRLLVQDAPTGTAAAQMAASWSNQADPSMMLLLPTYSEVLETIAHRTEHFTGASLAAVVRAAASFALERSVSNYMSRDELDSTCWQECVVTMNDLLTAIHDFDFLDGSDGAPLSSVNRTVTDEDDPIGEQSVNGT